MIIGAPPRQGPQLTRLKARPTTLAGQTADDAVRAWSKVCKGLPFGPLRGPNGSPSRGATAGR